MDIPSIFLKDYRRPVFRIETVRLRFVLDPAVTTVHSRLVCRAAVRASAGDDFVLQGKDLETVSVFLDGRLLNESEYRVTPETLTIPSPPAAFTLETVVRIRPEKNTALEGLYVSGGNFFTQCEAEGFRRITWFADRPDVMARYTVTLEADRSRFPVLLANGNLTDSGELAEGRHFATFEDPFAKPCYLFALVAGNLASIEDTFMTCSGRRVALGIYVQHHNLDKCAHAMESLKHAMRWDEETFGLECDLDQYKIVAVDDFNMGAMENKGLNIFNSKFVLARPDTATDDDFDAIEAVVAHEYFHNWTGNRVTCRDWFQLSLKEGLTVFRDQEFSARMVSGAVKRIHDVNLLRSVQFPEDSGPMAHPVRPDHYIEINNFYTVTVYEKGAEVVRMLHTLLGADLFRKGLTLYLERHDGSAATTDDFVAAMEEVSGRDLTQFRLWYSQAGTPELRVSADYDPARQTFTLIINQSCPPSPSQPDKAPMHIPVAIGLLDSRTGGELPLALEGEGGGDPVPSSRVLEVRAREERFVFTGIAARPVASMLRDFSAPVRLIHEADVKELGFLATHDPNLFNRWEAAHSLAERTILAMVADGKSGRALSGATGYLDTVASLFSDSSLTDLTYKTQLLTLPSEDYLAEQMEEVDVDGIHAARDFLKKEIARRFEGHWRSIYEEFAPRGPYRYDQVEAGRRRFRNLALAYLSALDGDESLAPALKQFESADNMTDSMAALRALAHLENPHRRKVLEDFAARWQDNPLVMDKWFSVQATAPLSTALAEVKALMAHPGFTMLNPNRVRALIGAFCKSNPVGFHAADGEGYRFLADQVLALNAKNPQIAARLTGALSRWRRYDAGRRGLMRSELERIRASGNLSPDVYEVVTKSLA